MIGKIKGVLTDVEGNSGLIETSGGVFYKLYLPNTLLATDSINKEIILYTYLQVKEDDLVLYGFIDKKTLKIFEMLIKVDGVGPKMAFNILSFSNPDNLLEAVTGNNLDFFCNIPGVGKKTAQKILIELSSKLGKMHEVLPTILTEDDKMAVDALVSLGFRKYESEKILQLIDKSLSLENKIKEGIKLLTKK